MTRSPHEGEPPGACQEVSLGIPVGEVVLRGQDDKGKDGPAENIHSLDHYCPFAVARLCQLCPVTAIRGRKHHARADDAHHRPSLIEVVDIIIHDTVVGLDIPHERKPLGNDLWFLALSPLVVIYASNVYRALPCVVRSCVPSICRQEARRLRVALSWPYLPHQAI